MKSRWKKHISGVAVFLMAVVLTSAQTQYQPKFPGDPARSDSEAAALGYMRTVLRAQREYKKKHNEYAKTLADLVHTGSFTKRMTNTDRGDYTATFHSHKDGFELALTPKQLDAEHRSFYAIEDGIIHADEEKAASESSPKVK
jgi:type II secretory pathway pseudopilin PulG